MIKTRNNILRGISIMLLVGITACEKPGPAETAGKNLDQAAENVGIKFSDAIDKAGGKLGEQSEKAGVVIDDAEITSKIKAAILAERGLSILQISVRTDNGVVTLSGSVDTQAHSDMAKALSVAVSGVNKVNNQLVVKPK